MGSYAYLNITDATNKVELEDPEVETGGYLLAKYSLPPLWTALFEAKSIVSSTDSESDGMVLFSDKTLAIQRFKSRQESITQIFGSRAIPLCPQFIEYLEKSPGKNVLVDTYELAMMVEGGPSVWRQELEFCIRAISGEPLSNQNFSVPPAPPKSWWSRLFSKKEIPLPPVGHYLGYRELSFLLESDHVAFALAGCGEEALPWDEVE